MKKLLLIFVLLYLTCAAHAQRSYLLNSGKITFERQINTFAVMTIFMKQANASESDINTFINQYRSSSQQFKKDTFDLYFDKNHSLYTPLSPDKPALKSFAIPLAYKNLVFSNFENREVYTEKQIFEKPFFIKDSIKTMKWKITDETKEIAGFECRRANGLIADSIYIVAFYTDEIPLKSGPESFNGLPGMILGIAIPHEHVSIFANAVTDMEISPARWKMPQKDQKELVNNSEYLIATENILKASRRFFPWMQIFINL